MSDHTFVDDRIIDNFPDIVPKRESARLRRFVDAHDEQLLEIDDDIIDAVASHQIDNASDQELDQIGRIFGSLGRRRDRSDDSVYRAYLKSLVQSFSGRGTVPGVRFAVAAGLNTQADQIGLEEHYDDLEYSIVLDDWGPHSGRSLEELAELSDASVSRLRTIRYTFDPQPVAINDPIEIGDDFTADDESVITDTLSIYESIELVDNVLEAVDSYVVNPKNVVGDGSITSDSYQIDPNRTETSDSSTTSSASNSGQELDVTWGNTWGQTNWGGDADYLTTLQVAPGETYVIEAGTTESYYAVNNLGTIDEQGELRII